MRRQKSQRDRLVRTLLASVAVFVGAVWLYAQVDWAIRVWDKHAPRPDETTRLGAVEMTQEDAAQRHIFPELYAAELKRPVARTLLMSPPHPRLWVAAFCLSGLIGWCASVWLSALQPDGKQAFPSLLASFFLAALAGVICYGLVFGLAFLAGTTATTAGQVLALLAGLFVTTFYQNLKSVLEVFINAIAKAAGGRAPILALTAGALVAGPAAEAQSAPAFYYVCTAPPTEPCVALKEADKKECPACQKWLRVYRVEPLVEVAGKSFDAANVFLDVAAAADGGKGLPRTPYDHPITTRQLYADPGRFGYRVVALDDADPGALVVYPGQGGFLVEVAGSGDERIPGLVYPSARAGGQPRLTLDLDLLGEPKVLVREVNPEG